jgi:hypothetical protein
VTGSEPLLAVARRHLLPLASVNLAQPGDMLVFRMQAGVAKHAGVLVGGSLDALSRSALLERNGHFIHAVEELGVTEAALTRWWRRRLVAAFSLPISPHAEERPQGPSRSMGPHPSRRALTRPPQDED